MGLVGRWSHASTSRPVRHGYASAVLVKGLAISFLPDSAMAGSLSPQSPRSSCGDVVAIETGRRPDLRLGLEVAGLCPPRSLPG